jgi:hypothetical protein
MRHWYSEWKNSKPQPAAAPKTPRTMGPSEEIVWLRENVLKKGPKNNPPYADAAKRLAELYATNYPGMQEEDQ